MRLFYMGGAAWLGGAVRCAACRSPPAADNDMKTALEPEPVYPPGRAKPAITARFRRRSSSG